ncbi:MAG: molybdenum cofactor guanylyltransferase [Planctomycetales bacterium]|nr:molybdenum cofactor guanylyltransferase [Planctomycetales bacterium]
MRNTASTYGAVVLCGGQSSRMGKDKANLLLGGQSLLSRALDAVSLVVPEARIVCVAAKEQKLPVLSTAIRVVRDPRENLGPLAALATGLRELPVECDAVVVTGCDHPLLSAEVLEELLNQLGGSAAVIPEVAGCLQPLPAVYSISIRGAAEQLLHEGRRSLHSLLDAIPWRPADMPAVRSIDPELLSFLACNNAAELAEAERLL